MTLRSTAIVALIGAMPVFLLVASITKETVSEAQPRTMKFLETWGGIAPSGLHEWLRVSIGSTAGFGLLMALALGFNELGDATMPTIAQVFGSFGDKHTAWSIEHRSDWRTLRDGVKANWKSVHPAQDLVNDPEAWTTWKNNRGKGMVRSTRALVFFSALLIVAGVVDLRSRAFRGRGVAAIVVGCLAFAALVHVWVDQKSHYIREVHLANVTLGDHAVLVPPTYPGSE